MTNYRIFFKTLLILIIIGLPLAAAADFWFGHRDKYANTLYAAFNRSPSDVLYFGDSTIRFTGDRDRDKTGIDQFFQAQSGLSVCTIASPSFSALLFARYVHLLEKSRYRPKLVIIPINLRSFSETGIQRPAVSFKLKQIYTNWLASGRFEWQEYIKYRFLAEEDILTDRWHRQTVIRNGSTLGTNRELLDASNIREVIDYRPDRELIYARQLALKFNHHYMMDLHDNHPLILELLDTAKTLDAIGVNVLFYITPINVEDGRSYIGNQFQNKVEKNIQLISSQLKKANRDLLDLHNQLPHDRFVHKKDVFEHLDTEGRKFVGEKLAIIAKQICSKTIITNKNSGNDN